MNTSFFCTFNSRLHCYQRDDTRISTWSISEDCLIECVKQSLQKIVQIRSVGKVRRELIGRKKEGRPKQTCFGDLWKPLRLVNNCFSPALWCLSISSRLRFRVRDATYTHENISHCILLLAARYEQTQRGCPRAKPGDKPRLYQEKLKVIVGCVLAPNAQPYAFPLLQ